ncbi:MAG: excinuclease ABC subunit UvrA [Candidatus Pacebacteria bacterium]|jgi:excinuclease ABC subunit A|nr:excinuclease ABC subunit UvrA [Candidatus Paceibacterota bacterium]MBT3511765.1 excinuclease ABC subunit UvrA [Candidatus Paceibacterota bacterium]MBT4005190.1 excinuclease ABC subunit UvrA [Candidatus Paceibacterota bacterium]MBT4359016.1 excinuclease ABC subunit UvrA [Candidatus Paceibacterota bacterium]MBT4681291.1 excinuclease ABC subunit UvrA [Candidatus Paceibacterota bacterium]
MIQDKIVVTGAREHNLKDVNVTIPKNKLVVFTGLSGSGKSSLAFDTLYAEGQRRYVESLSSYARQFLGVMSKPDVDQIDGLSPAISIDQKTTSHNPRSTVGTITEIYDYLRLLYARIGHPHCPECNREISTQSVDQIVGHIITELEEKASGTPTRFMVLSPVVRNRKGEFDGLMDNIQKKGYVRARIDSKIYDLNEELSLIKTNRHTIEALIDRLTISQKQLKDKTEFKIFKSRLNQSIEEALKLSEGYVVISFVKDASLSFPENPKEVEDRLFSESLACSHCGISIEELEPRLFSFNSPQGACETCNGLGTLLKIDAEKMIAPELTLSEGAVIPFASALAHGTWWSRLIKVVIADHGYDFRQTRWEEFDEKTQKVMLYGSKKVYEVSGENRQGRMTSIEQSFEGFLKNLERRYQETNSDFIRHEIEKYMLQEVCPSCNGDRLKDEALAVFVDGKNIAEITALPIDQTLEWAGHVYKDKVLSEKELAIGDSILKEINARLKFLTSVGLEYISLNREASTLAGGEAQRIRLASQIGTGLTGVMYILDEPTIGLHQRDNHRLIDTLKNLRDKGNTVIVVEHDRDVIMSADEVVDFGPEAGKLGGKIVAQGSPAEIQKKKTLTAKYLSRKKDVIYKKVVPDRRYIDPNSAAISQENESSIRIEGATKHNLKKIDVEFPLRTFTAITGVSGSGKSTLLHDTLYHQLATNLGYKTHRKAGHVDKIVVPDEVRKITLIDQSPIGKTPRSNPATYTKVFDYIRKLFAATREAQIRGYKAGRFSFNVKGGRCESCQGDGQIKIEMQFLPDVYVTCDVCHGKRYSEETLEVTYKGKNIHQILKMEIEDAFEFFDGHATLRSKLQTLLDVGLGYLELGQPAPTLSGGEAQRVKLAKELSGRVNEHVVYLLDEPTTGLHFHDVQKLLDVLHQLVENNNTVIVIEHNLDIIKNANWIIDLGPEGGGKGGEVLFTGKPEDIIEEKKSYTGKYLKEELKQQKTR